MTVDLDALEALAKAATSGPWEAGESEFFDEHEVMSVLARRVPITWDDHSGDVFTPADARFIAAANPTTVLALMAELRQERERAENGSCWDDGPQMRTPGGCDPMPPKCELRAGHLGAHRGGQAEWMRNPSSYRQVSQERDEALAVIERVRAYLDEGKGAYAPDLYEILNTDPVDALGERDAEKWDEGAARVVAWNRATGVLMPTDNPYRETKEQD